MKETIRKYDINELIILRSTITKADKELLDDFLKICSITAGESKIKNIERVMLKVIDTLEIPLSKLNRKILIDFLGVINKSSLEPSTKNEIKKHFKRFILNTPLYKHNEEVIEVLKMFKLEKELNDKKVNPDTILHENEVNLLMRATSDIKLKCLIILSWETAGRPQEILDAKWENINFNNKTIRLQSTKTKQARLLPLSESTSHLERLKEEWDFPDRKDKDFIFVGKFREQRLSNSSWEMNIKKLSIKALGRVITPYLIRHGRLTLIQDSLSSKVYEDYSGHSLAMATRYRHPSQGKLLETMKKGIYNIKELTKEQKDELEVLKKDMAQVKKQNKYLYHWIKIFTDRDSGAITQKEATLRMKALGKATDTEK